MPVHCGPAFIENKAVYFRALKVYEFFEKVLEFYIGRSLKVLETRGIWDVKMCMNPVLEDTLIYNLSIKLCDLALVQVL